MANSQKTPQPKFLCFYESYGNVFADLKDAQAGRLIKAMSAQFFGGEAPQLKGIESACFNMIKYQMEADKKRYQNVCERNRKNSQARWKKHADGVQSDDLECEEETLESQTS